VSHLHKPLLAAALCFRGFVAPAESAASEGVYTPKALTQSTPMRVEVIDGVTFRDIETGLEFRLFGVDACQRDQIAHLGRQPWQCGVAAIAWLTTATLNKWVSCNALRKGRVAHRPLFIVRACRSCRRHDQGGPRRMPSG
jgi:endonuclease YncB( thermonuclease family)